MNRVPLPALREGMVLARAVLDPQGAVLLREGTLLTSAWIARIREAGVDEVFVDPAPLSESEREARRAEITERSRRMFAEHASDPVMQSLARISLDILLRRV